MSVGYQLNRDLVDGRAGTLARKLRDVLRQCQEMDAWLDSQVNADLEALGYSPTEVAQLKSAYTDAAQLATIFAGGQNLAVAKDFRTFLNLLIGP